MQRGDAVRPGGVGAEAALLLGLVVDVADLEVALRLERRLDPLHVRAVRVAVDLVRDLLEGHRAIRRAADRDAASLRDRGPPAAASSMFAATFSILFFEVRAGQVSRRAADDDAARAVVAEPPRAGLGVALDDPDPVELAAEGVGDDLGDAGLVAAARAR